MGVLPPLGFVLMRLRRAMFMPIGLRSEVIRCLTAGRRLFGLFRLAPEYGKACIL